MEQPLIVGTSSTMPAPSSTTRRQILDGGIAYGRRAFADSRVRTLGFAYLFAIYSFIQPFGYRRAYPTSISRLAFATSFGNNKGLRIFYGEPYDLATVSGYTAWRVGGILAIAAAIFGVLAAVRALRAEEDAGRMEIMLAGLVGRRTAYMAAIVAIGLQAVVLWVAEFVGFLVGGLPIGGSAYLALATVSLIPVFAGIGAIASEIAPTRRLALELGCAIVALFLLLRVVADTTSDTEWLRWLSPLGWAEELRPFTGSHPLVLLLPVATTGVLLVLPVLVGKTRDIGSGLIPSHDDAEPRLALLSSPIAQAFRSERGSLIVWASSVGAFGFILGVISESVSSAGISKNIQREIAKLGSGSIVTPTGYVSLVFFFFILAISLFACAQLVAARREEAEQQLETLLALPVGRSRWLGGRLILAAAGTAAIAIASGVFTWLGALAVGTHISFPRMLEAGANCLPVALFFLGIAALTYAALPRASAAVSYGIVLVTFLWQAVGSLLGAPKWIVDLTPFGWIGLVPAQGFRATAAVVMIGIGIVASLIGLTSFRHRDLLGA
jgi:ABC-2 type transport system permease protein